MSLSLEFPDETDSKQSLHKPRKDKNSVPKTSCLDAVKLDISYYLFLETRISHPESSRLKVEYNEREYFNVFLDLSHLSKRMKQRNLLQEYSL